MTDEPKRKRTAAPCPGCGYQPKGDVRSWRPVDRQIVRPRPYRYEDEVCSDCKRLLDKGREVEANAAAASSKLHARRTPWHAPHYSSGILQHRSDGLGESLRRLCAVFGRKLPVNPKDVEAPALFFGDGSRSSDYYNAATDSDRVRFFTQEELDALHDLDFWILVYLRANHDEGLRDGTDILSKLKAGDISPSDFEEARCRYALPRFVKEIRKAARREYPKLVPAKAYAKYEPRLALVEVWGEAQRQMKEDDNGEKE